jgi:hypothetical protein
MSNEKVSSYEEYKNINDIRLFALEEVEKYFTVTLKSDKRDAGNGLCVFYDTKNKIGRKPEYEKLSDKNIKKRLILFSLNDSNNVYADAIMYDDGSRDEIDGDYMCSYKLITKSIRYFKEGIPFDKIKEIWTEAKGQQSAIILGEGKSNQELQEDIKEYLKMTEGKDI